MFPNRNTKKKFKKKKKKIQQGKNISCFVISEKKKESK